MGKFRPFQNPFLLALQGFVAGALLLVSTSPGIAQGLLRHAAILTAHSAPR